MDKMSDSLESIEEEASPISIKSDTNNSLLQEGIMTPQDWIISSLNIPLSALNTGKNDSPLGIKLFTSFNSSVSSSSIDFNQASEIEIKKSHLLQKYRNSPAKKESPSIFQNQLKNIIKKRTQASSAQNLVYYQSTNQLTAKRSKSFNSIYNNPTEILGLQRKVIKNIKKKGKRK